MDTGSKLRVHIYSVSSHIEVENLWAFEFPQFLAGTIAAIRLEIQLIVEYCHVGWERITL